MYLLLAQIIIYVVVIAVAMIFGFANPLATCKFQRFVMLYITSDLFSSDFTAVKCLASHIFSCLDLALNRYRKRAQFWEKSDLQILLGEGFVLTELTDQGPELIELTSLDAVTTIISVNYSNFEWFDRQLTLI